MFKQWDGVSLLVPQWQGTIWVELDLLSHTCFVGFHANPLVQKSSISSPHALCVQQNGQWSWRTVAPDGSLISRPFFEGQIRIIIYPFTHCIRMPQWHAMNRNQRSISHCLSKRCCWRALNASQSRKHLRFWARHWSAAKVMCARFTVWVACIMAPRKGSTFLSHF